MLMVQIHCLLFCRKTGYSKFGKYNGNGNNDGTFVYTGFKPSLGYLLKEQVMTDDWIMYDNKRKVIIK